MGPNEPENTTPPVEPEQQPITPVEPTAPVETQPAEVSSASETPAGPAAPQLPVKKSKKGLIIGLIAAGVVVLSLVTATLVYALVYNSPENAVVDAFSKAMTAKSGSVKGAATIKSQDSSFKLDINSLSNEAGQNATDVTGTITTSGKDYTGKGHFAGTKNEYYIKLDDLRTLINGALGAEYSDMIDTYYGSLLDKIDGKWVVIKQSDLDELSSGSVSSKESQCVQDELTKLQTDASLRKELTDVYRKNPLFTITSKGSDADGNHYSLVPVSDDKAKNFITALVETKFFKAVDDCTSSDLKKELTDSSSSSSSSKATGSLEVWVDGWSHNLKKFQFNIKDSETELTSEFKTTFNNNPAVTLPKADTTVDDLKSEIQKIQDELTASYSSSSMYDYSY